MQDSVAQVESISDGILENLDLLSSSAAAFYSAHRDELVLFGVLRSNDVLGIQAALSLAQKLLLDSIVAFKKKSKATTALTLEEARIMF